MTSNTKIVAWTSIIGAALIAGFTTSKIYFPNFEAIATAIAGLIGAVVAYITTKNKE